MLGRKVDADALQAVLQIARRIIRIVGQDQKLDPAFMQPIEKVVRAGDQFAAAHNHAVHIDQITLRHRSILFTENRAAQMRRAHVPQLYHSPFIMPIKGQTTH